MPAKKEHIVAVASAEPALPWRASIQGVRAAYDPHEPAPLRVGQDEDVYGRKLGVIRRDGRYLVMSSSPPRDPLLTPPDDRT